jgi:hypothetical protein
MKSVSNYDEALERFHRVDLEYGGGLANHGPMGAEALESLGHSALIPAFADIYAPRLQAFEAGQAIDSAEVDACLGEFARRGDWVATFEARLQGGDWRDVVASYVPGLLAGLFAGAGHGLLRVAHAVRALEREDSALRRRELAFGLGHWAARYQTLPGLPGSRATADPIPLEEAFENWPLVDEPAARAGLLSDVVARLETFRPFVSQVERVALPTSGGVDAYLDVLCRVAAGLYVAQPSARVAYVHALTIPSAVRLLVPHLPEREAGLAAAYAMQAMGALHSMFGETDRERAQDEPDAEVERIAGEWDETRYHAACSIQEHSIKMTEACWREHERTPDPIFGRAAADAALKIEGRGQASIC